MSTWSYNPYRATLLRDGEPFAIVTPDGKEALPAEKAEELVRLLSQAETLTVALRESVGLQAHYASLLNRYDGGQRLIFDSPEAWLERLRETGTLE